MPSTISVLKLPDCQVCGACCLSDYDAADYIHLSVEDINKLTPQERSSMVVADRVYGHIEFGLKTRKDNQTYRCIALVGNVGERVSCSIYDRRPKVCREFPRAGCGCLAARARAFEVDDIVG